MKLLLAGLICITSGNLFAYDFSNAANDCERNKSYLVEMSQNLGKLKHNREELDKLLSQVDRHAAPYNKMNELSHSDIENLESHISQIIDNTKHSCSITSLHENIQDIKALYTAKQVNKQVEVCGTYIEMLHQQVTKYSLEVSRVKPESNLSQENVDEQKTEVEVIHGLIDIECDIFSRLNSLSNY